jgi:hypothetical protein
MFHRIPTCNYATLVVLARKTFSCLRHHICDNCSSWFGRLAFIFVLRLFESLNSVGTRGYYFWFLMNSAKRKEANATSGDKLVVELLFFKSWSSRDVSISTPRLSLECCCVQSILAHHRAVRILQWNCALSFCYKLE